MNRKHIRKFFSLADYLDEELFLQSMHKAGWKMINFKALGWQYTFEKCEPEDYIYQLDFKQKKEQDEADYLLLFADCGWEHFFTFNGWYYFRKVKSEAMEENMIFNDAASRAEMAKKIMSYQWLIIFPTLIFLFVYTTNFLINTRSFWGHLFTFFYLSLALLAIGIAVRNYLKLNKIIEQNTLL
ncbi:DUF2812 domain-containing protein [Enterococcus sp. LJL128]|uniref:DUF2812 domain-containing protein n=1 Tax=Enterococcus sp. LJL51 TaxID=3416656 RepID=UPI003CEC872E